MKRSLLLAASLLLSSAALLRADDAASVQAPPVGVYKFDTAHSQLGFKVPHLVISTVNGKFDTFEGTIVVKSGGKISVEADADADSVDTGNAMRDAHLKGGLKGKEEDFFYSQKYPKLAFKSDSVTLDGQKLTVVGDLTIRGVTKKVTFEGTYNGAVKAMGGENLGASVSAVINRQDYGLKFSYAVEAGPVVGDNVTLNLDIAAVNGGKKKK